MSLGGRKQCENEEFNTVRALGVTKIVQEQIKGEVVKNLGWGSRKGEGKKVNNARVIVGVKICKSGLRVQRGRRRCMKRKGTGKNMNWTASQ